MKRIFQNWHNIPQHALPSYMLLEGHTPGDETLYLLARLSNEVDVDTATKLLKGEIEHRNQNLAEDARSVTIMNVDIRKVLNKICPTACIEPDHPSHRTPALTDLTPEAQNRVSNGISIETPLARIQEE